MFRSFAYASLAACVFGCTGPAFGLPPIYVYGEPETPALRECLVTYESAIASAKAALRYNAVEIASHEDSISNRSPDLYINLMGGAVNSGCVVSISARLEFHSRVLVVFEGRTAVLPHSLCDQRTLLTGSASGMQSRLNAWIRDAVDICIAQYEAHFPEE